MSRKNVPHKVAAAIAALMPRKNLVIVVVALIAAALGMDRAFSSEDDRYYQEMEVFSRIMHEVINNYVTEPDTEKLFEGAGARVDQILPDRLLVRFGPSQLGPAARVGHSQQFHPRLLNQQT